MSVSALPRVLSLVLALLAVALPASAQSMRVGVVDTQRAVMETEDGLRMQATASQLRAEHQPHLMPIAAQRQLVSSASHNREMRADFNHGHPGVMATARPVLVDLNRPPFDSVDSRRSIEDIRALDQDLPGPS